MSKITIYNDGTKDAQVVVLNHLTLGVSVHHQLPAPGDESEPINIELGNGDLIIVTLADKPA